MLNSSLYLTLKTTHLGLQLSEVSHYVSAIRGQVIKMVLKAFQLLKNPDILACDPRTPVENLGLKYCNTYETAFLLVKS